MITSFYTATLHSKNGSHDGIYVRGIPHSDTPLYSCLSFSEVNQSSGSSYCLFACNLTVLIHSHQRSFQTLQAAVLIKKALINLPCATHPATHSNRQGYQPPAGENSATFSS